MKKHVLSIAPQVFCLLALFLLFSSFVVASHPTAIVETKQSFWSSMQGFSFQKLGFWQKTALLMGVSSLGYAAVHRQYRRHYDEGIGCLGILGIIILVPIVIALLPVLLIVGLVMLILGLPFPHFDRHRGRGRRYDEGREHRRHRRYERY